jgi:hypothetical protein
MKKLFAFSTILILLAFSGNLKAQKIKVKEQPELKEYELRIDEIKRAVL